MVKVVQVLEFWGKTPFLWVQTQGLGTGLGLLIATRGFQVLKPDGN